MKTSNRCLKPLVLSLMLLPALATANTQLEGVATEDTISPTDAPINASADDALVQELMSQADDVSDTPTPIQDESAWFECATIINNSARLSCFDAVAQGEKGVTGQKKQAIALGDTFLSTVRGNRQVVFADSQHEDTEEVGTSANLTPLSLSFDLDKNSENGLWSARPHNPVYILPVYLQANPNRSPQTPTRDARPYTLNQFRAPELKFQISLKSKMAEDLFGTNADLWFGYTHLAHWQVYNEDNSRPFRAHDYEPEVFLTQPVKADLPFGGRLRMLGAGLVHHSNGESDKMSRSWNRAYVMAGMEWDKLTVMPRLWTRLSEKNNRPDDNPDATDYYGFGDVKFLYQMDDNRHFSGVARYNLKTGKGALQLDYVQPIGKGISGYIQLFQGYGQSFIDYNHNATSIGVGVMLTDWMGL